MGRSAGNHRFTHRLSAAESAPARVEPGGELRRLDDEAGGEPVLHHRVGVPRRALHLALVELAQDVVERLLTRPVVRRPTEVAVDRLLVPHDAGERVLVLVRHAEGVADLVQCGRVPVVVGQVPAEVHRRLVDVDAEHVPADVGPRAVVGERDPDLRLPAVVDLGELEPDAEPLPLRESVPDRVRLRLRSLEEVVVEQGSVDPLRADQPYGARPARLQVGRITGSVRGLTAQCGRGAIFSAAMPDLLVA